MTFICKEICDLWDLVFGPRFWRGAGLEYNQIPSDIPMDADGEFSNPPFILDLVDSDGVSPLDGADIPEILAAELDGETTSRTPAPAPHSDSFALGRTASCPTRR